MKSVAMKATMACLSLVLASLIYTGQSYSAVDMSSALAVWLFDEGAGDEIKDFTGNGNDGVLMNGPVWVEGKYGMAISLDGVDDQAEINDPVNMVDPDFTIMVWVNPGETQANAHCDIISNHGEPPSSGYCIEQHGTDANLFYTDFSDGNSWQSGWGIDGAPLTQMEAGVWQHFAVVRQGTTVTHYLNGEETGSIEGITDAPVNASPKNLMISNFGWRTIEREFNGIVDELAIFNEALSLDDIKLVMNSGLAVTSAVSASGKLATTWAGVKVQH